MQPNTNQILDGKALAQTIQTGLAQCIQVIQPEIGRPPGLAVLMVGDNPASAAYVRNKERACGRLGIASFGQHLATEVSQGDLAEEIDRLNQNEQVDGILIQLPLPPHLDAVALLQQIAPDKDADGLHPMNLGRLVRGEPSLRSCTPAGIMELLRAYNIDPKGQQAVVVGRSILVGKPIALMLLEANATVTIAHSHTVDLFTVVRQADILVVAAGQPGLIQAGHLKPGAIVIDVGINRVETVQGQAQLIGDVDFEAVRQVASWITPVPGGVGPMTVTMLLYNTLCSYLKRHDRPSVSVSELIQLAESRPLTAR